MKTVRAFVIAALGLLPVPSLADNLQLITHCRLADTRFAQPSPYVLTHGHDYDFSVLNGQTTVQGGQASCNIPTCATGVGVSLVAVNPTGPGFFKTWERGGVEPISAAALNFFRVLDVSLSNYPVAPGRFAWIKLSGGSFTIGVYWYDAQVVIDAEAYTLPEGLTSPDGVNCVAIQLDPTVKN